MPESLELIVWYAGVALGIAFGIALLGLFISVAGAYSVRLYRLLAIVDATAEVVDFGESTLGRFVNETLTGWKQAVDEPEDTFIQWVSLLPVILQLRKAGVVDNKQISDMLTLGLSVLIKLSDGKAETPTE